MSEPAIPATVNVSAAVRTSFVRGGVVELEDFEVEAMPYGTIPLPPPTADTAVLCIVDGKVTESVFKYLPPVPIGQTVDFPWEITIDSWIDPQTKLHYFKPCGRTFGNINSNADFVFDGFEKLFLRLWANQHLQLFNDQRDAIAKTNAQADWDNNCCLALPYIEGVVGVSEGADDGGVSWSVGMSSGASHYTMPLPRHDHEVLQLPHFHNIKVIPHNHYLGEGFTYDTNAGESASGSDSAYHPYPPYVQNSSIAIELQPQLTNVRLSETGNSGQLKIQNAGVGVQKMIYSGVMAT